LANRSLYTTKLKTAPLVAGGVYCREDNKGNKQFAILLCCTERNDGRLEGWLQAYGYPKERVLEGSESLAGWDLVASPASLSEPIRSERFEDELTTLKRENASLKKQLKTKEEVAAQGFTPDKIKELRDGGLKWTEVGEALGVPWQTAKKQLTEWERGQATAAG
tara:strand:+ start:1274 stop:1765 length:492 start_codon:yes stop_codon:yes gene_type:complete